VKIATLESAPAFALLGPGFSADGRWFLLRSLRATAQAPRLVFAPFEARGRDALGFDGEPEWLSAAELDLGAPTAVRAELRDGAGHRRQVDSIRAAIAAGDVYQVCLTLRAELGVGPGSGLLAALCARGVPRFAAWVRLPGGPEFVSASPELFFETEGARVRSEPMKGTAAPGDAAALVASEKDQAELAMITDLLRNDLTPLCVPRSVRVPCDRQVIALPYAQQTVSVVEGTLLPGLGPRAVLDALHPGGSVTGAPKNAALRQIAALESTPRGPYCGALGLCGPDRAVFSLLIRTATRAPAGWVYGVGGGIVWDSEPALEMAEIQTKLGALGCSSLR